MYQFLQGSFLVYVAFAAPEIAFNVSQIARQDLPEPGRFLRVGRTAEIRQRTMRLQQRLLDHIRRIELPPESIIKCQSCQEPQVAAELCRPQVVAFAAHGTTHVKVEVLTAAWLDSSPTGGHPAVSC